MDKNRVLRYTHTTLQVIFAVALPNVGGIVGSAFTQKNLVPWHAELIKPNFNPPNWVFSPVWIVLYCLTGLASFLVWRKGGGFEGFENPVFKTAISLYITSLVLNWLWSPLFFGSQNLVWSSMDLFFLTIVVFVCGFVFYRINRLAGIVFIPYFAWVTFATILNFSIYQLN